jgi:hypothetical protein
MTKGHQDHHSTVLPSVEALTANDDELLTFELRVSEAKRELVVARALVDLLEQRDLLSGFEQPSDPALAEEIARLGRALIAVATALSPPTSEKHILFTADACR